jgi:4-amino-4-deoxy-L-arabinose transferase-like glycosyltransferase
VTVRQRWFLLIILLLACGLRAFRLDAQSIWYDEGLSIFLAQHTPAQTMALSAVTDHPPLHALLLNGWLRAAGASDFSSRFPSVFFGVLAVALTHALGARFDRRVGLIGAALLALSPLAVYYSQEARGYSLLLSLVLIAAWAGLRLMTGDHRRRMWLAYAAAMSAALYTHYFAAFAWAAINLAWIVGMAVTYRHGAKNAKAASRHFAVVAPSRFVVSWLIAQVVVGVLFAPWLPNALAQAGSNATYFPGRVTWQTVIGDTWRAFTIGEWGDSAVAGWLWFLFVVIGIGGSLIRSSRDARQGRRAHLLPVVILLTALTVVPLAAMSALAWLKPKFAPRYLLPALPAVVLLASIGVVRLADGARGRFCRLASIGLAASLALPLGYAASLLPLYIDSSLARPDVRSAAQYIQTHAEPSDAILLIGGHQAPAFTHYYHGTAPVIPLPPDLLPAAQSPLDARAVTELADLAAHHPRLWLVLWQNEISDPTDVVLGTLTEQAKRLTVGQNFHNLSVLLFDVTHVTFTASPQRLTDIAFAAPVKLIGYNVNSGSITIDTPLRFGLYLETTGPIDRDYRIFTHLVDAAGALVAQADHIAGADSYPMSLWRPGSLFLNRFEIRVPAGTAPGEYRLVVGLYDAIGRLKLADGRDQISLFTITVSP